MGLQRLIIYLSVEIADDYLENTMAGAAQMEKKHYFQTTNI